METEQTAQNKSHALKRTSIFTEKTKQHTHFFKI